MRLLRSDLDKNDLLPRIKDLVEVLYREIPSGVGSKGRIRLSSTDERALLRKGSGWAVENSYGSAEDLEATESGGCIEGADPDLISGRAYERGRQQMGTLGSGNHFLEIQFVDLVYDNEAASVMGLHEGSITVMIHTGSRGFGHQVCTDYIQTMTRAASKYGIDLPDKELVCAPFKSREGQQYLGAMRAAANYAWANRQCITHWTREVFMKQLSIPPSSLGMSVVYDVAHNIAKIEEHVVKGKKKKLVVHRKGATRAFPPGHGELPELYRKIGQPVLIPGDMGRASYVLTGTHQAMDETFGSTCHGAGRLMSRNEAIRRSKGRAIWREMEDRGVIVRSAGRETLAEEMPEAYKDISQVVDVVHNAGISKKVARLKPLGVVKG